MARAMKGRNEVKTLASITGQPEEDVVAMLKQHGGDVNAATNALMDSACPVSRAPSTLRFPVLSQRFFGEAVGGREKKTRSHPGPRLAARRPLTPRRDPSLAPISQWRSSRSSSRVEKRKRRCEDRSTSADGRVATSRLSLVDAREGEIDPPRRPVARR